MKVLSVGEMVIDFLPGAQPRSYLCNAGGAPANFAIALARQGCEVSFCGMLGDDDFGRFLQETLKNNHVTLAVKGMTKQAVTTMAFVSLSETGERSFTFARKPGADMLLRKEHIRPELIDEAGYVHAGSCSLSKGSAAEATRFALEQAAQKGKIVSFDVNYRHLLWDNDLQAAETAVRDILPFVDLLKISEEELNFLGGEPAIPDAMERYGLTLVMLTLGAEGAKCYWNGRVISQNAIRSDCVDATGAGDAFWGGFIATLIRENVSTPKQLSEALIRLAMENATVSGALCVRKKGAIESLPTLSEIEAYQEGERA